jgi:hypothetical protein
MIMWRPTCWHSTRPQGHCLRLAHCILTCRLVLAPNGTLYISDLGNGNATVWSNELLANRTTLTGAASCTPYSLAVLSTGTLVEKDCANRTVWVAPPLAGGAHSACLGR